MIVIKIDGSINPVSADHIHNGIKKASQDKAECLVILSNTLWRLAEIHPGHRQRYTGISGPVVVYVAPGRRPRRFWAGVFILIAAHIAAMAPGTNIGAAHPVDLQGKMDSVMSEKATK